MPWNIALYNSVDMAVHAALMPTGEHGRILYFGGYLVEDTHIYDITDNNLVPMAPSGTPGYNAFCGGHAFLADGRLLVAGGQRQERDEYGVVTGCEAQPEETEHAHGGMTWGGERKCAIFSPLAQRWDPAGPLNLDPAGNPNSGGRWYPTLTTLANGEVLAVGGHPFLCELYPNAADHRHSNNTPERYNAQTDAWTLLASDPPVINQITADNAEAFYDYQRNHLLPNGRLFFSSMVRGRNRIYDTFAGVFLNSPDYALPPDGAYQSSAFARVTSTLLPLLHQDGFRARVLVANSVTPYRIDLGANAPEWEEAGERDWDDPPRRYFACPVLLPDGRVFFSGGTQEDGSDATRQANAVLEGELYDPEINWENGQYTGGAGGWETVEAAAVPRHYHSTALLMPNGNVWTAGSNGDGANGNELRIEIYEPDYGGGSRPVITSCPANTGYGYPFTIGTPDAESIERVVLIRCGSITHSYNPDQRLVSLPFSRQSVSLQVTVPLLPDVLPPGYYMVWIVDTQDRPCEWARFIRISRQKPLISLDVSTYSIHEVAALGTPAEFSNAVYLVYDGFLPGEVETPSVTLRRPDNTAPPGMSINVGPAKYEAGSSLDDIAQRIVFPCTVRFTSQASFNQIPAADDFQNISLRADMRHFSSFSTLTLSKNPNPRMSDGDPHWLSIDLRAFSTQPGAAFTAGINHPSGGDAPFDYIQSVLEEYNASPAAADHPFDSLPQNQATNRLPWYSEDDDGNPLYNYAIARVRFRAPQGIDAVDVRVFFRLWTTGWSALEYNTNGNYRRFGDGADAMPLLGLTGGEISNVPCFASPRVTNMEQQTDSLNRRTLEGADAQEVLAYFGCWLDFNQGVGRFPLKPQGNGPFDGELLSIQELIRGPHQCLVAEIHYTPDPIAPSATPASSDNLAQRNLLLDESDNPGSFTSHLVCHTLEIKPSPAGFPLAHGPAPGTSARFHPDELTIEWGNLPRDSHVTFYIPKLSTPDILRFATQRQGPGNLALAGAGTLSCKVTDIGFLPIPGPFTTNIPALVTVQLPPNVAKGQRFTVRIRQVDGRSYRVLATTQFDILVKTAAEIIPSFRRTLAVIKHVAAAIPESNRWYPVFQRYLETQNDRIRAFGIDPDSIGPSSTGGKPDKRSPLPGRATATGNVCDLVYDCHGQFEGFVVDGCEGRMFVSACGNGLEQLVRRACHEKLRVSVYLKDRVRLLRLVLHCCC